MMCLFQELACRRLDSARCVYVCICVCIYIHIKKHIYIYIYTAFWATEALLTGLRDEDSIEYPKHMRLLPSQVQRWPVLQRQ